MLVHQRCEEDCIILVFAPFPDFSKTLHTLRILAYEQKIMKIILKDVSLKRVALVSQHLMHQM
jgi:hypothetical protein